MSPTGRRPRPTLFVLATIFIDTIGFGIVMPVLPQLVMELGHGDIAEATRVGGWLALLYALMQFLFGPLMGNLGDRFGRRPVLLASLAGFGLDYLLMGFAPSLFWLFVGRMFAGIFGAVYGPATAALADLSTPEERARVFGLVGAAFGVGFIVGPSMGGLLGEISPRAPFLAAAGLAGVNLLYGLFVLPETLKPELRRPFEWKRANPLGAFLVLRQAPGVLTLSLVYFLWEVSTLVYPCTWSFYAIARYGWSTGMIGLSLAWSGIGMALVQALAIGRAVEWLGERRTALVGMVSATLGFVAFIFAESSWMAFTILTVTALQGLAHPTLSAMMSRRVSAEQQGEIQGFIGSTAAVAAILAPLLLNEPLSYFTSQKAPFQFPGAAFAVAALVGLVSLLLMVFSPPAPEAPGEPRGEGDPRPASGS